MNNKVKILVLGVIVLAVGAGLVLWKTNSGSHSVGITKLTKEQMELLVKDFDPMQQRMLAQSPEQKTALVDNLKEFLAVASQARKEGFANKPAIRQELKYVEKAVLAVSYDKIIRGDKPLPPLSMITEKQVKEYWGEDTSDETDKKDGDEKSEAADAIPDTADEADKADETGDDADTKDEAKTESDAVDTAQKNSEKVEAKPDTKEEKVADKDSDKDAGATDKDGGSGEDSGNADGEKESDEKKSEDTSAKSSELGFIQKTFNYVGLGALIDGGKSYKEAEFKRFVDAQLELQKERGQRSEDLELKPEETEQLRDSYARIAIYSDEAKAKMASLSSEKDEAEKKKWEGFSERVELQTQLQKAQLLTQSYVTEKLRPELEIKDEDVQKYIDEHPDLVKEKKEKADEVLKKAQGGEDFQKLVKEYSEDPGSKETGGLFENVTAGAMVPEFEKAALALEEGQISSEPVRTKFGYHIIKLVKKGETEGADGKKQPTYDARHILISTSQGAGEENPFARPVPLDDFVKDKLQKEKQEEILKKIKEDNPIEIATDFEITAPEVPEQQLPPGFELPEQGAEPGVEAEPKAPKK